MLYNFQRIPFCLAQFLLRYGRRYFNYERKETINKNSIYGKYYKDFQIYCGFVSVRFLVGSDYLFFTVIITDKLRIHPCYQQQPIYHICNLCRNTLHINQNAPVDCNGNHNYIFHIYLFLYLSDIELLNGFDIIGYNSS